MPFFLLPVLAGCGDALQNQTASLGGALAGSGGTLKAVFINNTNQRAVFTFGTYNQTDRESIPFVDQFGAETFEPNLDAGATSTVVRLPCGRVFAVGSERLMRFIDENGDSAALSARALTPGVQLFDIESDEDVSDAEVTALAGMAAGAEYYIGTQFNCESLVVIRIEINDPGPEPFRLDFEVVPAASSR